MNIRIHRLSSPHILSRSYLALAVLALFATTGCAALKVGKRAPDEFSVVTSAPLIIPPDYGLRPPEPSVIRERELVEAGKTEETLFGSNPLSSIQEASPGEIALLRQLGALSVDDNIRDQITRENARLVKVEQKSTIDKIIWWRAENKSEWSDMLGRGQEGGIDGNRPRPGNSDGR